MYESEDRLADLTQSFSVLAILIAVLIAIPLGYFVMNDWLQKFVYRIHISWETFLLAVAIVFVLTILTVGYELFKASTSNAAEALRYE